MYPHENDTDDHSTLIPWLQNINLRMDGSHLPLLICGGECLEWSEGSDRLSGERERLLRCLSCDRLEWSDAREWISEMSDQTRATVQQLQSEIHTDKSGF